MVVYQTSFLMRNPWTFLSLISCTLWINLHSKYMSFVFYSRKKHIQARGLSTILPSATGSAISHPNPPLWNHFPKFLTHLWEIIMLYCGYHSLHQVQESPFTETQSNWIAYLNSLPFLRDPSSILLVIQCLKYSYISSSFLVVRSKRINPFLVILP